MTLRLEKSYFIINPIKEFNRVVLTLLIRSP